MDRIALALLRGVCQMPAYVAHERGLFRDQGIAARIEVAPTAWMIPERMERGDFQFAVMPWTRVATAAARGEDLVLICGSGFEEAAIVVRKGLRLEDVQTLAVPQEGGIKDLTAHALVQSLGWHDRQKIRMPSGDGAILSLVGQGADAASMVEPYATMMEELGIGTIVRRTGDLWPGAPGCSLTTSRRLIDENPDLVRRVVAAFVEGSDLTHQQPDASAAIAAGYIGVSQKFITAALTSNRPNTRALFNQDAMSQVLSTMHQVGYLKSIPTDFMDLSFLREVLELAAAV